MFGMGWTNCISVLSCALVLANPVCRGAVWTAEDEARALSLGSGRLSSPPRLPTQQGRIWTQQDEDRARNAGQGRLRHVTPDFRGRVPQFDGRTQDGAAFDDYPAIKQDRGQSSQLEGRTQGGAAQNPQYDGRAQVGTAQNFRTQGGASQNLQYDGRAQDGAAKNFQYEGRTQGSTAQNFRTQGGAAQNFRTQGGAAQNPQYDGRAQDGAAQNFRTLGGAAQQNFRTQGGVTQNFRTQGGATQNLQYEGRFQGGATQNPQYGGRAQSGTAQNPQYGGRTQAGAAQNFQYEGASQNPQYDGRAQDGATFDEYPSSPVQATSNVGKIWTQEDEVRARNFGQGRLRHVTPGLGGQVPQFDDTYDGRTQAEVDQFENDAKVKDSAAENVRFDAQRPQINGRPQGFGAQEPQFGGRTQAELDYLEYLRAEQQLENKKIAEVVIIDPITKSAKFGPPTLQPNQIFEVEGRTQAELDYLEYLRAEQQFENDAKVSQNDGRTQAEKDYVENLGAEKTFQNDAEISRDVSQAELDYLEYLRAEQLEADAKIKDSAAENARIEESEITEELSENARLEEAEITEAAENARIEEAEDEPICYTCHLFENKEDETPVEVQPKHVEVEPERECLSCHLFDEPASEVDTEESAPDESEGGLSDKAASALPLPEVDTRKSASEGGYLQDALDLVTGIFQGEGTGRNPAPVNPRFGSQAEQYLEYRRAEQEEELEIDGILEQIENEELLDSAFEGRQDGIRSHTNSDDQSAGRFADQTQDSLNQNDAELDYVEYRQSLLDANTQESFDDRSKYKNLDFPDRFNTRFGGQREDQSATAARFGGQRRDQPSSFDTRHGHDQPAYVPRPNLPASFDSRHNGPRQNQPASADLRFRGQIRDQPASAISRFGGQPQDQHATSNTRFRGQKQDQFRSSDTRFGGQIQHQPRVGDQPVSVSGFEAELAKQRAAQTAYEAELEKHRAAQTAYEAELEKQRAAQTAYEDELAQKAYEAELAKQRAAQTAYEDGLSNQRTAQAGDLQEGRVQARVGDLQQEKIQTFEGGRRFKVAKLMDVDEEETLSAQPQRRLSSSPARSKSRQQGGCRSCFLLDE